MLRRTVLSFATATMALIIGATAASAADPSYPTKPIRWVVGFPAGGGSDFLARTVGSQLAKEIGQPIIIDNKPGASAMIGAETAARAPADGYTVWTADMTTTIFNPALQPKVNYKTSDFVAVGLMARFNLILVANPKYKADTLHEVLDDMRARPGTVTHASVGAGSNHHVVMELLKSRAKVTGVHVPYKGLPPALNDVMSGQVDLAILDTATAKGYVSSGKLRALAVASKKRVAEFPNVPTFGELGFNDVEMYAWQALMVPASVPAPIVETLAKSLSKALANPATVKALQDYGLEVTPSTPAEFTDYLASQNKFWVQVLRENNVSLEN